jgi:hypothetical protein
MAINYITARAVQQWTITIASGQTTGTATILSVGSGAFILFGGINPSISATPSEDFAYVTLTNATTITATRNTGTAGTVTVTGCIVDGDTTNLIESVQYKTVTISNLAVTGTVSITAVTNTNAAVHLLGWSSSNTTLSTSKEFPIVTLSGTTVTATRGVAGGILTVGVVVIEFQGPALNQSVQNFNITNGSSASTSYTASVTSVVTNNTLCIYGGSRDGANTTLNIFKQRGALTSSTVFTVTVNTGDTNGKNYCVSVVEFVSGVLNSATQRSTTTLTGATSATSALTPVTLGNAAISWLGNSTSVTTDLTDEAEGQAVLTSGSVVTVSKTTATGNITGSWEVIEFPAYVAGQIFMGWLPQYS